MIPENITRNDIPKALLEIDKHGVPKGRGSKKFLLVHDGKRYPPKYTLSVANRIANGYFLDPEQFSGGDETNGFLESLGFNVIDISQSGRLTKQRQETRRKTDGLKHDERCPECKETVGRMLEKAFGEVKRNYRFTIGSEPESWRKHSVTRR